MVKIKKNAPKKARNTTEILGIKVSSTSKESVLRKIVMRVERKRKTFVVTPNPEFIVFAQKRPWFREILNQADVAIPDGVGLLMAAKYLKKIQGVKLPSVVAMPVFLLLGLKVGLEGIVQKGLPLARGNPLRKKISGTDLMECLCQEAAKRKWTVYFLGGRPGVAKRALAALQKHHPGLKGWAESGPELRMANGEWRMANGELAIKKQIEKINQKKPTFLFVAFGMGKQEKFIWDNWGELKVKLAMGVGGAFDFLSGEVPRAPSWLRKIGLEWFYRLLQQPQRWKRIWTAVFVFPYQVFLASLLREK